MLRTILMVLALIVLVLIGLFYTGILHWPGGNQPIQANPVELKLEQKNVTLPAPVITTGSPPAAEPAPAQPTPAQTPPPAQQPAPQPAPSN
jgi:hypothetical protein